MSARRAQRGAGFERRLIARCALLLASMAVVALLVVTPGYHAATLLVALVVVSQIAELGRYVGRTNRELTRFLDSARHADYSQRFRLGPLGAGFPELGETFSTLLAEQKAESTSREEELGRLQALVEHVPVPLLSVEPDGRVALQNNAARRLFGATPVTRVEHLRALDRTLAATCVELAPGQRRLVAFVTDGVELRLTVAASEILLGGRTERLVSLQDIQSELDAAQLDAWQGLVRVLTHKIMNSITPVASLAKTAENLVDDALRKVEPASELERDLDDVKGAVSTVARRSDALTRFVGSYRKLTGQPPPRRADVALRPLLEEVVRLIAADAGAQPPAFHVVVEPSGLEVSADPDMLGQVLINLLQNAVHALCGRESKNVWLRARLNRRGRVTIVVADDGPGVPMELTSRVFVPFFTTRRDGSGIGLALTRQIMLAHRGSITLAAREGGGTSFTLTF